MNVDAIRGVSVTGYIGATMPALPWLTAGLLGGVRLIAGLC